MDFILCTNTYSEVGEAYNLPSWVVEAADLFTTSTGLNFSKVVGWQPYQVVHDSLHCLLGILPNGHGEEQIADIEAYLKGEDQFPLVEDILLTTRLVGKLNWYQNWFAYNSIPEDADLFDYLLDYQGWLYYNHPEVYKKTYK